MTSQNASQGAALLDLTPGLTLTSDLSERVDELVRALGTADAVLVGAGSGLSVADGDAHTGDVFEERFADLIARHGYHGAYPGGFHPYETEEERWAFWARNIALQRYETGPGRVYADLLAVLRSVPAGRDAFVLTTNVDHRFQRAGFDEERLFCTQGDYGLLQCSVPCAQVTYDALPYVEAMLAGQERTGDTVRVPTETLPTCPRCGALLTTNLRADDRFVQDEGWYAAAERYRDWAAAHMTGRVLHLELGVGMNTPVIIKYPFWRCTYDNPAATFASIDPQAVTAREIVDRSILIRSGAAPVIAALRERLGA